MYARCCGPVGPVRARSPPVKICFSTKVLKTRPTATLFAESEEEEERIPIPNGLV